MLFLPWKTAGRRYLEPPSGGPQGVRFSEYTRRISEPHLEWLNEALAAEAEGLRAHLAGGEAAPHFASAAAGYRASWAAAPPMSFGRLVGMLKTAVLAGEPHEAATYALTQLPADSVSPVAAYAEALAAAVIGDDDRVRRAAEVMAVEGGAFERTARALVALADGDEAGLAAAVRMIRADFAEREAHLTGVPVADTALVLERLVSFRP